MKQNYVGMRFGWLLLTEKINPFATKSGVLVGQYKCLCDCGKRVVKKTTQLKSGYSLHCGCKGSEKGKWIRH